MRFTVGVHRFVIVLLLEPLEAGDRFSTAAWPLHTTIVPTFFTDAAPAAVAGALEPAAASVRELAVPVLGDAMFGARGTVLVSELERTPGLVALHAALVAALEALGIREETPEHWLDGYRPHLTVKKHGRAREGDVLRFAQVALVDMRPGQRRGEREVLAVSPPI
ncbi:2'-5' RNA ligase family protein [Galbitalea sp. SE-J8]|uniref:2'-5' RNA ligase family protein n=1 Tax=Galbitalea sp. SE-J8 TaxID=3054952 RepID=UPI00259CE0E3|nr:2'-5' RNA ligase family protein [Galbitalea sp. SE-J8]MDM4763969.1 2'-5' RNA ligase family protein [Galbitalea sp. SE-J8]